MAKTKLFFNVEVEIDRMAPEIKEKLTKKLTKKAHEIEAIIKRYVRPTEARIVVGERGLDISNEAANILQRLSNPSPETVQAVLDGLKRAKSSEEKQESGEGKESTSNTAQEKEHKEGCTCLSCKISGLFKKGSKMKVIVGRAA